ncbi:MAG: kinase [Gammaproteobacteria bacterium]|nr:kinase [Chromatiales bacterium]MYE49092.1 kinase [Gammaproteobacteria bacterium]
MDWLEDFIARHRLPSGYAGAVDKVVVPLAKRLRDAHRLNGQPLIAGISGAQGSGKTTLALILGEWLERALGLATACLSLDGLYLRKAQRRELSRNVHSLLETRGVPGTHDVARAEDLLDLLVDAGHERTAALPVFDKALDDRAPAGQWPVVDAPVDVVLFEGWCVGARPQPPEALDEPVNALEADRDRSGRWRRYVNERLRTDYASLYGRLDLLVMLRVPNFEKVLEWRRLQEKKLRHRLRGESRKRARPPGMSDGEIAHFVQHYERLTRHMLKTMPDYADAVIDVDESHRMTGISWRERSPRRV